MQQTTEADYIFRGIFSLIRIRMRNWHITWFLNKHLSWVLKRSVSPFRWDGSFEHPKHMFELESQSKHSLILFASCRQLPNSRADVNWEVHHMSVDLQCFFSECMLVMRGSRGVQLWQHFLLLFFLIYFFSLRGGRIQIPLIAGHQRPANETPPFKWRFARGPMMAQHWMLAL